MIRRILCSAALVSLLSACSGASTGVISPAPSSGGRTQGLTTLTIRIDAPAAASSAARRRREYLSPATASLVYDVTTAAGAAVSGGNGYVNLTPGSSNVCSTSLAQQYTCSLTVPISITASGSYTLSIATYDAQQTANCVPGSTTNACAGNVLSETALSQTLTAGQSNVVALSLGGVPASVAVLPLNSTYLRASAQNTLRLYGPAAQQVLVEALDADGNVIVGVGAPSLTLSSGSSHLTVTAASASAPNVFTIQAPTSGSPAEVTAGAATLTATATPPSGTGASAVTSSVTVDVYHSVVYVADGNVYAFVDGNTTTSAYSFCSPQCDSVAVDGSGNAFVANESSELFEYPVDSTGLAGASNTATAQIGISSTPNQLAADRIGNVFLTGTHSVYELQPGSTSESTYYTNASYTATATAVDGAGNVYFGGYDGLNSVIVNATSSTTLLTVPYQVFSLAIDSAGTIYATNFFSAVYRYPAGSSSGTQLSGISDPFGLAVDAAGTLYVADQNAKQVEEFANGATSPTATISEPSVSLMPQSVATFPNLVTP